MAKVKKTGKKKVKKNIPVGEVHIQSSFNNTIITIADPQGNVVSWSSGGVAGFQGIEEEYAFRRAARGGKCREEGDREGHENGRRVHKGTRGRTGGGTAGDPERRTEDTSDQGCYSDTP